MRPVPRLAALLGALALVLGACSAVTADVERAGVGSTTTTAPPSGDGEDGASDAGGGADDAADAPPVRLGLAGPMSLDPAAISPASVSSMILVDLVHDTLTRLDGDGVAGPGLADFEPNGDRTVWRFHLRDDATFVDGRRVTADDVLVSIDRVRSQGGSSLAAIQLEDVQAVTAAGPHSVEFQLRRPLAMLPELLASPVYGIVDRELLPTDVGAALNPSGAYQVEAPAPDRLQLTRRRGQGAPQVELRLFPDDAGAFDAFAAGELDWAPVPVERLGEATELAGQRGLVPFHGSVLLGMNLRADPLQRPEVRRAISLAVDRTRLTEAVFGPAAQPMRGLVPAGVPGAAEECVGACGPDVAQARALLTQVFGEAPPPPLRVLTDRSATQISVAGVLERQLAEAGFEVTTSSVSAEEYDTTLRAGEHQLFLFGGLGLGRTPASHLTAWTSGSPDNLTAYANVLVDAAVSAALAEPDLATRLGHWRQIEATVLGDAPVVPLAQLRTVAVVRPEVQGLRVHADGSIDVSEVTLAAGRGGGG